MGFLEPILGGLAGGLTGAFTAWVTARGKVDAIRAEFDGKLRERDRERAYEIQDRTTADQAASAAARAARKLALADAATALISALNRPDAMGYNVSVARKKVDAAAAEVLGESAELAALGRQLQEASQQDSVEEAGDVLRRLGELRT